MKTETTEPKSVFDEFMEVCWPYKFKGRLFAEVIAGGVPSDPKVAEGWIKTKMDKNDQQLRDLVEQTMEERNLSEEKAIEYVNRLKHLIGFKRDEKLGLYIEGRQLKAAIKEAAGVARSTDKLKPRWGSTSKGVLGFVAEHIFVEERRLFLKDREGNPIHEYTDVLQSFPRNPRTQQTGIQYMEVVRNAFIDFTVVTDYDFEAKEWGMLWGTGQYQGVGASRSQGFGRYIVTEWEKVK